MEGNEDFGFEDFESALFDSDYQTDVETDTDESTGNDPNEETQETDSDSETEGDEDDLNEDEEAEDSDEEGAEAEEEADDANNEEQTFTIKVNKEERTVTLEEMTAFAQKGADYDRVKEQNNQLQQTNASLQAKLDDISTKQGALDILSIVAEKSGSSLEQLAESLYVNFRKSAGASEDVAREELKSAKLEKELNTVKAQQTKQQEEKTDAETRAQHELEDFKREYPDVDLTEDLVDKLVPDIQKGMSLSAAFRKYEKAQDTARIAELERKLTAKAQNDKNKRRSPGSQQDSGGRRTKSDFEEFEAALFN